MPKEDAGCPGAQDTGSWDMPEVDQSWEKAVIALTCGAISQVPKINDHDTLLHFSFFSEVEFIYVGVDMKTV